MGPFERMAMDARRGIALQRGGLKFYCILEANTV